MKKDKTMLIQLSSRKEAIADGALIDVTATAKEAGIRHPTALTREVWERFVKVPHRGHRPGRSRPALGHPLDVAERRRKSAPQGDEPPISPSGSTTGRRCSTCVLKAICGPGDDLEPVITVMLPGVA